MTRTGARPGLRQSDIVLAAHPRRRRGRPLMALPFIDQGTPRVQGPSRRVEVEEQPVLPEDGLAVRRPQEALRVDAEVRVAGEALAPVRDHGEEAGALVAEVSLRFAGAGYDPAFLVRDEIDASLLRDNYQFGWRFFPRARAHAGT